MKMKRLIFFLMLFFFMIMISCSTTSSVSNSDLLQVCNPEDVPEDFSDAPVKLYSDSWYTGINIYDWATGINTMDYSDYDFFLSEGRWTSLNYENCLEIKKLLGLRKSDNDFTKVSRILKLRKDLMSWENRHLPNVTANFIWETKNHLFDY